MNTPIQPQKDPEIKETKAQKAAGLVAGIIVAIGCILGIVIGVPGVLREINASPVNKAYVHIDKSEKKFIVQFEPGQKTRINWDGDEVQGEWKKESTYTYFVIWEYYPRRNYNLGNGSSGSSINRSKLVTVQIRFKSSGSELHVEWSSHRTLDSVTFQRYYGRM